MAKLPYQNRVLPTGEIVSDPARGLFMGNRGRIHTDKKVLGPKRWSDLRWIVCLLDVPGYDRREVMGPGYTELFFLDEAVALAAGHRPCSQCRREAYERFRSAWSTVFGEKLLAKDLDRELHAQRIVSTAGRPARHEAKLADLPDGSFVLEAGTACLVSGAWLFPFERAQYGVPFKRPTGKSVTVLTPQCTVEVLRGGYQPLMHESASAR